MRPALLALPLAAAALAGGVFAATAADAPTAAARLVPLKPIATARGAVPDTRVTLYDLRRTGPRIVTVRLSFSYGSTASGTWQPELGTDALHEDASGLLLVDEVHARDHEPLSDADGDCLCTSGIGEVRPGETIHVAAKFPAPPPGVRRVSLHVPGFDPFDLELDGYEQ